MEVTGSESNSIVMLYRHLRQEDHTMEQCLRKLYRPWLVGETVTEALKERATMICILERPRGT